HTIEVEGNSEIMIIPDEGVIHITVQKKAMTVSEATKLLNADTKKIIDGFKKSGIDHDLTANNYYVNVNRIYQKDTSKDSGYVASQNLEVIMKDIERQLPEAMEFVSTSSDKSLNVKFLMYTVKQTRYKNQSLELARKDANEKAANI